MPNALHSLRIGWSGRGNARVDGALRKDEVAAIAFIHLGTILSTYLSDSLTQMPMASRAKRGAFL
ncbi:MAG: hypothetical protein F6K42_08160 [Leptolyngbya sp. SIO1D8]|nr:hypothetical protein [Leptolyngbya sp. SIO1D8]